MDALFIIIPALVAIFALEAAGKPHDAARRKDEASAAPASVRHRAPKEESHV